MSRRLLPALLVAAVLAACGADAPLHPVDRGIGGTGAVADRGIGGTGIVGTVTAFGSIWVNGHRVALPPVVTVRIEGRPAGIGAVDVGQMVAAVVDPGSDGAEAEARSVEVRYAVAGPVEAADGTALTVLGQRVDLAGARLTVAPRRGVWVAVSGLRRSDGGIAASRIDSWEPARGWLLRAAAGAGAPGLLALPGLSARLGPGVAIPEEGLPLRVTGHLEAGQAVATEVQPDPLNPFGAGIAALSVEVFTDPAGRPVGAVSALSAPAPATGRVVVEGSVDSVGVLHPGRAASAPGVGRTTAPGLGSLPGAAPADAARPGAARPGAAKPGMGGRGPGGRSGGGSGSGSGR